MTSGAPPANASYAGEVSPKEAWEGLKRHARAQLVDVRTEPEWNFVGVPDLSSLSRTALFCEWQTYPTLATNAAFTSELVTALSQTNYEKGAPIYFICRSGARSRAAAQAMTAAGHTACFNVSEGFEGGVDAQRHRGHVQGWKAASLPWVQS